MNYLFKYVALLLFFLFGAITLLAEDDVSVSAPTTGGVHYRLPLELSFYHENALYKGLSIYGEVYCGVGYGTGIGTGIGTGVRLTFMPALTLEPRIYYSLKKRAGKGFNLKTSPGGFFNGFVRYRPFEIYDNILYELDNKIHLGLGWGQKKQVYKKLHYELGLGFMYSPNVFNGSEVVGSGKSTPYFRIGLGYTIY